MVTYAWSISGNGIHHFRRNTQNVTVTAGTSCNSSFRLTLTITDNNGCINTCNRTIFVNDTEAPDITCRVQGTQNVYTNSGNTYLHGNGSWDATATDNCSTLTYTYTLSGASTGTGQNTLNGVVFSLGSTTVTWRVTDACGNSDECSFIVFVYAPLVVNC